MDMAQRTTESAHFDMSGRWPQALVFFFFFMDRATPEISPLPLPAAFPIFRPAVAAADDDREDEAAERPAAEVAGLEVAVRDEVRRALGHGRARRVRDRRRGVVRPSDQIGRAHV